MNRKIVFIITLFILIGCSTNSQLEGTWRYIENRFITIKSRDGVLLETYKGVVTYPVSQQRTVTFNANGTCSGLYDGSWLLVENSIKIKDGENATSKMYTIKYLSDTKLILESSSTLTEDSLLYNTVTTQYFEH